MTPTRTPPSRHALLFDLDGVIVDSNPVHVQVWRRYLSLHGIDPGQALPGMMYGRRNDEIVRDFFGAGLPPEEIHRHGAEKEALYRRVMSGQLPERLVPGVSAFLERSGSFAKAVVSNAEPANVEFILNGAGLRRHFQVVVDGHQVARPKPAPDLYLLAAELLGTRPQDCIVFEDSAAGLLAAKAAGSAVVAVATTHDSFQGADLVIRDFLSPELIPWLEKMTARP